MSTNNDLSREAYFKESGKKFHRDRFGIWFINDKFWESIRIKDIVDDSLKRICEDEAIKNQNEKSVKFEYEKGMTVTIWLNKDNDGGLGNSNVSRKSAIEKEDDPAFDKDFDIEAFKKEQAEKKKSFTSSSGGKNSDRKNPIYIDEDYMSFQEYQVEKKKNKWLCLNPKADPNTFCIMRKGTDREEIMVMTAVMTWDY